MGLFSFGKPRPTPQEAPRARTADDDLAVVFAYHRRTKHAFQRFAAGPHGLDWASQPDPFRRYVGANSVALARPLPAGEPWYEPALRHGARSPRPIDLDAIGQLLFDSFGLSAWKRAGDVRWALRVNPSSGNLHPTEATLIAPPMAGLGERATIAHYAPREHALELRAQLSDAAWLELARGLPPGSVFVGLSSIHWREAWKYGERAFRYCQHDVGHGIAALAIAAAALGWRARLLEDVATLDLARLLGLWKSEGIEREEAECLVALVPQAFDGTWRAPPPEFFAGLELLDWHGAPNVLSSDHQEWGAVEAAALATHRPRGASVEERPWSVVDTGGDAGAPAEFEPISLRAIVHQRRSALALDARTGMARDAFYQTLARCLPEQSVRVFDALPWRAAVHLFVFVHRVEGLDPGLYLLVRDVAALESLRAALDPSFAFERPPECAPERHFFLLKRADARAAARSISCHQEIAADGCFSLGMLAQFRGRIESAGPWFYRRLFWECGAIGQVLYLEAEALGLRGTGIGCFFDDPLHEIAGLRNSSWQSLYHFTLGGALEDPRITSEPAYTG